MKRSWRRLRTGLLSLALISGLGYGLFRFHDRLPLSRVEGVVSRVVAPVTGTVTRLRHWIFSRYDHYQNLKNAQLENEDLKAQVSLLRSQCVACQETAGQETRLGAAPQDFSSIPARVIGYDPKLALRSITIDRGSEEGVREDQAVVAQGSLVGRVVKAWPKTAQVLLINDVRSNVDVLASESRAHGTLVGLRRHLELNRDLWITQAEYFSSEQELKIGDRLVTSGMDSLFPKGIPVGTVRRVEKDKLGIFWRAEVLADVELSKLEEVWVLKQPAPAPEEKPLEPEPPKAKRRKASR